MRFLFVLVIWFVFVGGLWGYIQQRDKSLDTSINHNPIEVLIDQTFSMEITPTFTIEADPFALSSDSSGAESLDVRLNGTRIQLPTDPLSRGNPILLEGVKGITAGHNEVYVKASPPLDESRLNHGIRIKILNGGSVITDQTVWGDQGALVSGTVSFKYISDVKESHDH